MLSSRHLSRRILSLPAIRSARAAYPLRGASSVWFEDAGLSRRTILVEADLAPLDELSDARQKLRRVLDDYRQQNFGQTLFSRFIKEMVAATDTNHDGKISMQEMKKMLKNIGVDGLISQEDLQAVFEEVGHNENGEPLIYVDEVQSILTQSSPVHS